MIVGVIGPKGSGKSVVAKLLVGKYGFTRHAFADPLKRALMVAFDLDDRQVYGDQKEIPTHKLCGRTPRHAMMTLGTEWGRELIHPDIWATAWYSTLPPGNVVVDDLRFPNEFELVKNKLDGYVVSVRRPGYEYDASHASERHSELEWDFQILNDGDLPQFQTRIINLYEEDLNQRSTK